MRIAMFTDAYQPQINGMVTSIDLFTNALRAAGHEVHIFTPHVPNHTYSSKYVHTFRSLEFSAYKEYRIGLPFNLGLDKNVNKIKFDMVHVHSPFSLGLAGIVFAKYHGLPLVGTFHTMFSDYIHYFVRFDSLLKHKKLKNLLKKITWKYVAWFYNKCDLVIAPSSQMVPVLKKNGIKNVIYLPTGMDTSVHVRKTKAQLKAKYHMEKNKIILHVGRVTKEKNIDFILASLQNLLKNDANLKFIITSDGPYRDTLVKKVESLKLEKNVLFTGYVSKERLEEYYHLADVFVMASSSETQGLVLLEAVRNFLPIVVLDAPVISDFVRESSVGLVSRKNTFSADVKKVLENNSLRKTFEKNCAKTLKKYDIRECTRQLLSVYEKLIASNKN